MENSQRPRSDRLKVESQHSRASTIINPAEIRIYRVHVVTKIVGTRGDCGQSLSSLRAPTKNEEKRNRTNKGTERSRGALGRRRKMIGGRETSQIPPGFRTFNDEGRTRFSLRAILSICPGV